MLEGRDKGPLRHSPTTLLPIILENVSTFPSSPPPYLFTFPLIIPSLFHVRARRCASFAIFPKARKILSPPSPYRQKINVLFFLRKSRPPYVSGHAREGKDRADWTARIRNHFCVVSTIFRFQSCSVILYYIRITILTKCFSNFSFWMFFYDL